MNLAPALDIAAKDLRLRVRDRSALVMALVGPLLLATIVSLTLGPAGTKLRLSYGYVDLDRGGLADSFVRGVREQEQLEDVVRLRAVRSPEAARALVRDGELDGALVFPRGATRAATEGSRVPLEVVTDPENELATSVARAMADSVATNVGARQLAVRAAVAAASDRGVPLDTARLDALVQQANELSLPVVVESNALDGVARPAGYFGPSMAILFLFFTVQYGAISLLGEREGNTLSRLRVAGASVNQVLLGKALVSFLLGIVAMAIILVFCRLFLGVHWGSWAGLAALAAATVVAVTGIMALVTVMTTSRERAIGYASLVTFTLGLVGGNFLPLSQMPELLRRLALLTPNGWALRGFADLASGQQGASVVWPSLLVLVAFGALTGALAASRARRVVVSV